jgi:catechol 2,3-dioxygenase-like lactoylglutathione lyase family enzyme
MPLDSIVGLDHVVVVVRDLAKAADAWRGLGFTVSDQGTHSAHMGTGNHTLMLGEDYLELLGVLTPTERNAPTRALLEQREGIERLAFTTLDAATGVSALQARGIAGEGPIAFSRPVELPDGSMSEARFETFLWPRDERPGGVRLFACQHFTRETVWLPHLQDHANTAHKIVRLEMLSADPKAAAEHMCRLTGETPERIADGWRVQSGGSRGVFEFVDRPALFARHYGVTFGRLPQEGAMTLVLQVRDLAAAKTATAKAGAVWHGNRVTVPPANANGVILVFQT